MGLSHRAHDIMQRAGLDVSRYRPELDWNRNFMRQLQLSQVGVILDVGANSGQYAAGLRAGGFDGRIVSFEPLSQPFVALKARASTDPLWEVRNCALGDSDGSISINIAGNAGESSSVLPMLKAHQEAYPPANYVGDEHVTVHRLDSIAGDFLQPTDTVFLKIDVQGFEKQVIAGAHSSIQHCIGMQLELSFLPLYEGGMLIREALDIAYSLGYTLTGLSPCFTDTRNGRTLQADGVFFRTGE